MPEPRRILIIRPSALGDVCRSVPVLASLRAKWPGARIDWLVQDVFADAIRHHPMLSGVVEFPRRSLGRDLSRGRFGSTLEFVRGLRSTGYDVVVDAQGLARSGLLALASGARRRVGYADARELGWVGLTERHRVRAGLHAVDRMLGLVEAMGVPPVRDMRLYTDERERTWVSNDFRLSGGAFAVIAPTSRWAGKRWGWERFVEVARRVLDRGLCVAVVGGPGERGQVSGLEELARDEPRVVDLVGATSVGRLMAVIERSRVVVACDSAALHMAVGLDRPSVGLYGPTRVDLVGPYVGPREPSARSRVVVVQHVRADERLDHKNEGLGRGLMERIGVDEVWGAVESLLG